MDSNDLNLITKTSCSAHDDTARIASNFFCLEKAIALVLWLRGQDSNPDLSVQSAPSSP